MSFNLQNNRIISSSNADSLFRSFKPPDSNAFNSNSSILSLLSRIEQYSSLQTSKQIQSNIGKIFPQQITIIYKSPTTIPSHLNCPICYQILCIPTRLYCGHTFCYKCLETILQGNKVGGARLTDDRTCPICRQIIDKQKVGKDKIAQGIIEDLIVVCPRQECTWEGIKKQIENHYKNQCLFKKCEKQKPLWQTIFPEHAPKESVDLNTVTKGSLLGRIYAKNKQLQQKTTFEQLKKQITGQKLNQQKPSKRQQRQQKIIQKQSQDFDRRLQLRLKQIEQFEQICRQKTPQQLQKQYLELQRQKTKQRMQKRQDNMKKLDKLLKVKELHKVQENKKLELQKQIFIQKEKQRNAQMKHNFNLKLNCLQRLMSCKQPKQSFNEQMEIFSNEQKQQEKHNFENTHVRKLRHPIYPNKNNRGMFKNKPINNQYLQRLKGNTNFTPYHEIKTPIKKQTLLNKCYATVPALDPKNNTQNQGESTVIIPSSNPRAYPQYLKKPHTYAATYQKHRLVRRPYVPPPNQGVIPEKIPHRYFTSIDQFSDPQYLAGDKANRRGQYQNLEFTKKYIGVTNMKFKP